MINSRAFDWYRLKVFENHKNNPHKANEVKKNWLVFQSSEPVTSLQLQYDHSNWKRSNYGDERKRWMHLFCSIKLLHPLLFANVKTCQVNGASSSMSVHYDLYLFTEGEHFIFSYSSLTCKSSFTVTVIRMKIGASLFTRYVKMQNTTVFNLSAHAITYNHQICAH